MSTIQFNWPETVEPQAELTAQDERVLRRLFEEVYGSGGLQIADELVARDFRGEDSGTGAVYRGPAGLKTHAVHVRSAFFGMKVVIESIEATSNGVEVSWTIQGQLERAFLGIEPVAVRVKPGEQPGGPVVRACGHTRFRLVGGMVQTSQTDWNRAELSLQAG